MIPLPIEPVDQLFKLAEERGSLKRARIAHSGNGDRVRLLLRPPSEHGNASPLRALRDLRSARAAPSSRTSAPAARTAPRAASSLSSRWVRSLRYGPPPQPRSRGRVIGAAWGLLLPGGFGFFTIFLGVGIGWVVVTAITLATNKKLGPVMQTIAILGVLLAYLVRNVTAGYGLIPTDDLGGLLALAAGVIFAFNQLRY